MASLEKREHKGPPTYRVLWREDGERQAETFGTEKQATRFRLLVEGHGNRWPAGWVKGQGFADAVPTAGTAPTFGDWAQRTIAARARANDRTRADYLRDIRLHLEPTFGAMPLDEITREDVGRWLIELAARCSAKTMKNVHGLASSIAQDAVNEGLIGRNVFKGAAGRVPSVKTEEMVFLSRPEMDAVIASMHEHYRPFALFLALTGLRWSEATALTVGDVSLLGRKTVTVSKAWKRQVDGTMEMGEPKSRRSRRTLSLSSEAVEALIPLVSGRPGSARLFTSPFGHTIHHGNFRNRIWLPAIRAAQRDYGLEKVPRIHDIRHSHASWLIAAGVPLPAIQRRLGHESIQTSVDRYGHMAPEMDDTINRALDGHQSPALAAALQR